MRAELALPQSMQCEHCTGIRRLIPMQYQCPYGHLTNYHSGWVVEWETVKCCSVKNMAQLWDCIHGDSDTGREPGCWQSLPCLNAPFLLLLTGRKQRGQILSVLCLMYFLWSVLHIKTPSLKMTLSDIIPFPKCGFLITTQTQQTNRCQNYCSCTHSPFVIICWLYVTVSVWLLCIIQQKSKVN